MNDLSPRERDIAMVFQSYALYPHMAVAGNLAFPLKVAGSGAKNYARVREVAGVLGLETLLAQAGRAVGRAAAAGGAGPRVGAQPQGVPLRRAPVQPGRGAAHADARRNQEAAQQLGRRSSTSRTTSGGDDAVDRVVVMSQGEVQQVAPPRELYDAPANLFVAGFSARRESTW